MRIALVTTEYPGVTSHCGGVGTATEMLASGLAAYSRCSVDVVVADPYRRFRGREVVSSIKDVNVYIVGGDFGLGGKLAFWLGFPILALKGTFSEGSDIVHYQTGAIWAIFERKPKVLTVHGVLEEDVKFKSKSRKFVTFLKSWMLRITEGWARRHIPNVIAISEYSRSFLNGNKQQIWSIPNSISDEWFEIPLDRSIDWNSILVVSRLTPLKNIIWLINSIAKLKDNFPEISCRIAGGGDSDYVNECQSEISRLNLNGCISLLGNLDRMGLSKEMGSASCLVLPSLQENAPMVIAEALAAGVPVLATDVGGVRGMLEGSNCKTFTPGNFEEFCALLVELRNNPVDLASLRESARNKFNANLNSNKTAEVYRNVLKGKKFS